MRVPVSVLPRGRLDIGIKAAVRFLSATAALGEGPGPSSKTALTQHPACGRLHPRFSDAWYLPGADKAALDELPHDEPPTTRDWVRLTRDWRDDLNDRIDALVVLGTTSRTASDAGAFLSPPALTPARTTRSEPRGQARGGCVDAAVIAELRDHRQ